MPVLGNAALAYLCGISAEVRFLFAIQNKCLLFALNKNGFITAIDPFKVKQRLIVDVVGVALAHPAASLGNVRPRIAENVTSSQNGTSDGIAQSVDELRCGHLLRVHRHDEGTQLLGAAVDVIGKRGTLFTARGLPYPIAQLVLFFVDLKLDFQKTV